MCLPSSNHRMHAIKKRMGLLPPPYHSYQILVWGQLVQRFGWTERERERERDTHTHTHTHTHTCMHTAAAWWSHGSHGFHCPTLFSWDENYAENGITHFLHSFLLTSWSFPTTTIHSVILDNRKVSETYITYIWQICYVHFKQIKKKKPHPKQIVSI